MDEGRRLLGDSEKVDVDDVRPLISVASGSPVTRLCLEIPDVPTLDRRRNREVVEVEPFVVRHVRSRDRLVPETGVGRFPGSPVVDGPY